MRKTLLDRRCEKDVRKTLDGFLLMFLIDFLCFFRFSTVVEVAEDLISFTYLLVFIEFIKFETFNSKIVRWQPGVVLDRPCRHGRDRAQQVERKGVESGRLPQRAHGRIDAATSAHWRYQVKRKYILLSRAM